MKNVKYEKAKGKGNIERNLSKDTVEFHKGLIHLLIYIFSIYSIHKEKKSTSDILINISIFWGPIF